MEDGYLIQMLTNGSLSNITEISGRNMGGSSTRTSKGSGSKDLSKDIRRNKSANF